LRAESATGSASAAHKNDDVDMSKEPKKPAKQSDTGVKKRKPAKIKKKIKKEKAEVSDDELNKVSGGVRSTAWVKDR